MTDHMVCLTIDGQEVQCQASSTVYEAATAAGIHIPTFCHHEKLEPVGACRMCLVEIEGARGLQTSCTTPVREGMVVKVHTSPEAVKARKANIEFLLTNHPLDCPVCDKGGECPLQDQALLDGPGQSRYVEEKRHKNKRYPLSELIVIDQERCVLCWRCIRYLDEWAGDHQLDLFGRGSDTRIVTFPDRPLSSKWQGNTIELCPVGALTSRVFRFEARVWELTNTPSVCPLCSVGCNLVMGTKNNELRRITPRENSQVNDTWLCDKGRFAHAYVDHPDRLKTPLIRRDGELKPATWDEALAFVAGRFTAIINTRGPQAIAGLGSTHITNEANYLFQRFMRTVVGSNNIDHLGRRPEYATPPSSLPNLEQKDVILLLGCDPSTETPMVEMWLKKAVLRHGAKVIVANPRQIELGQFGGPWLAYRPGSEAALMNGLARAILDTELESKTTRVTNMEDFRGWLRNYAPQQVERMTGVQTEALQAAAQLLSQARRPIILYGSSWVHRTATRGNFDAMLNLALLLGDIECGYLAEDNNCLGALEMGVLPHLYPGRQPFDDPRTRNRLAGFWGWKLSPLAGLGFEAMLAAAEDGSLEAMWLIGTDPADDCRLAGQALGKIPFLVVQDLFLTQTASLAEVVLPAASFAETEGSYINLTGRWQAIRPGLRPPGEARPDWWIIAELARQMVDHKRARAWNFAGVGEISDEISKVLPALRGVTLAQIGERGWQQPLPERSGRRAFVRVEFDQPPHNAEYPLQLVTGRVLYDHGTLLNRSEPVQKLAPDAFVMLHPHDAERLGLTEGEDVSVVSASGQLSLSAKISDNIVPGVAFAPMNLSDAPLSVLFANLSALPHVKIRRRDS